MRQAIQYLKIQPQYGASRLNFHPQSLYTVNVITTSSFFNNFINLFEYLENTMNSIRAEK